MKFTVKQGRLADIPADVLVVGVLEGSRKLRGVAAELNRRTSGSLADALALGDFKGAPLQTVWAPAPRTRGKQILLVGTGEGKDLDLVRLRDVFGTIASACQGAEAKTVAMVLPTTRGVDLASSAAAATEAMQLATYDPGTYKSNSSDKKNSAPSRVIFVSTRAAELKEMREGIQRGGGVAAGVLFARDLVNRPSNLLTPRIMAKEARKMASSFDTLSCRVSGPREIERLGMGGLQGVGQGSVEPPQFIQLEYRPKRLRRGAPRIALVGKGITFDTGGISLKTPANMDQMKFDMGGAAAVLGAFRILGALQPQVHVYGYVAAAENMPSGNAIKPGDLLTMMNGMTVEVNNTDAEGRLVLADAIHFAKQKKPDFIIDAATLTGACLIALGDVACGLMSEDDKLVKLIQKASERSGERVWRLPLMDVHRKKMKGHVADLKNTGPREGGALTAAGFLSYFATDVPWAHLDIAGTVWNDEPRPTEPKGATGYGARLFAQVAEAAASGDWS